MPGSNTSLGTRHAGRVAPTLPYTLDSILLANTTYIIPTSGELNSGTVDPARIRNIVRGQFWHKQGPQKSVNIPQLQYTQLQAAAVHG